MKVNNPVTWSQQETDIRVSGQTGERFLTFLHTWLDTAENYIDGEGYSAGDALRKAFDVTEQTLGFIEVEVIGMMLALALGHWEYGQLMDDQLTTIERRVMDQALAVKMEELKAQAAEGC